MSAEQATAIELDETNVAAYVDNEILPALDAEEATEIEPVSEQTYVNWIFRVVLDDGRVIYLRQTRDHVKSKPDISMDPTRIAFEVRMLELVGSIIPGVVPEVLHIDGANNVAVLSDIRRGAPLLVDELRSGRPHPETGPQFGADIGAVHRATLGIPNSEVRGSDADNEAAIDFHLGMRLEPALTEHRQETEALLAASREAPQGLVLGDLASKNIFVEGDRVRFLDLERAFVGDQAFDLAFLFCHYLIENQPEQIDSSLGFIENFIGSYRNQRESELSLEAWHTMESRLKRFLGVTLLYRIDGFYLVVDVGEDKNLWRERAAALLADDSPTPLLETLKGLIKQ